MKLGDEEDLYNWTIALIVINPDSLYYGGYFKAKMSFPTDYPYKPPGTQLGPTHINAKADVHQTSVSCGPFGILTSTKTESSVYPSYTLQVKT